MLFSPGFHRLQDPHEKDFINCDAYLEQVFACPRMRFAEIPNRLHHLQQPPDSVVINHVIVNNPEEPSKTLCYDIEVEVVCDDSSLLLLLTRKTETVGASCVIS